MASWYFDRKEEDLHVVVDDEEIGPVKSLEASKKVGFVQVVLATLQVLKLCIENFKYEASSFCGMSAPSSPSSRTVFVKRWRKYLKPSSDSSSESSGSEASSDVSSHDSVNECVVGEEGKKTSVAGLEDQILNEHFIGTYDVHLSNLCPPDPSRCTRVVDHDHVNVLTESFKDNKCEQLVILVGMLTDSGINPIQLKEPNYHRVEILGGNHTREALQTLMKKGLLEKRTVKVNLYNPLARTSALAIGFQHNYILQEKRKPTTFLEKVSLMRECWNSGVNGSNNMTEWKEMLVVIFRAKDRRTLQQKYTHHLLMARVPEDVWVKFMRAGEVTEKFYRQLMRISSDTEISKCLDVLLVDGTKAFKTRVTEVINNGTVRSKKDSQGSQETSVKTADALVETADCPVETSDNAMENSDVSVENAKVLFDAQDQKIDDLQKELSYTKEEFSNLKLKYSTLEEENNSLRKEIERLKDGQKGDRGTKRSREIRDDAYTAGEKVEAFWRFDDGRESWLPATILTAYADGKMYKVRYDIDDGICKVSKSWIRRS